MQTERFEQLKKILALNPLQEEEILTITPERKQEIHVLRHEIR